MPSLLDVPTGLGKTAAAVLSWLWRRRFEPEQAVRNATPSRLVYCLPMRVLVEQTYRDSKKWLQNLRLWADRERESAAWTRPDEDHGEQPITIHLLLGGEEKSDWALWPEHDAILVGTQDMILSRALNRGYSAGRARWPLEFGFLNNDCLWVFDEIQLMDTGLATSLQLDAWRRSLPLRSTRAGFSARKKDHASKPSQALWMSATMARHWLERAVDWSPRVETEWNERHQLTQKEQTDQQLRSGQLFEVKKTLTPAPLKLEKPKTADKADAKRKQTQYLEQLAEHIGANHPQPGLTLIIVNTVDRATELFKLLPKQPVPLKLIHSRFRPLEREQWRAFLDQKDQSPRILVSTQVVEAGVDLSASVLYTELAPWASLVQRFGRCARYPGESGQVFWLDLDLGSEKQPVDHWAKPYERLELNAAREKLKTLPDVGLKSLAAIKAEIDSDPTGAVATTGADVDISRFIRDGEELDIQVFWRELSGAPPTKKHQPDRRELCPVPFHRFCNSLAGLRKSGHIWRRNYRRGWERIDARDRDQIYRGQVYLLEKSCGGYSPELGWTGDPHDTDFELPPVDDEPKKEVLQDDEEDADDLSISEWLNVLEHTRHVCKKLDEILGASDLPEADQKLLRLAARWHDRGKVHEVFQSKLKGVPQKLAGQVAKAPDKAWQKNGSRRGFRHELASALAIFETLRRAKPEHEGFAWPEDLDKSDFDVTLTEPASSDSLDDPLVRELGDLSADELDLLVYLVAAHHGKVRMSIRSSPDDACPDDKRQARGVRDDDPLPACQLPSLDLEGSLLAPEVTLSLDLMELGLSPRYGPSWRERMQLLMERLGPFRLAYLEGLLRAADCRASIEEDEQKTAQKASG
jgi:CRISPR-associated endonuclease/helicase Cas3